MIFFSVLCRRSTAFKVLKMRLKQVFSEFQSRQIFTATKITSVSILLLFEKLFKNELENYIPGVHFQSDCIFQNIFLNNTPFNNFLCILRQQNFAPCISESFTKIKINLNFYFHFYLSYFFMNAFIKPFETPQISLS